MNYLELVNEAIRESGISLSSLLSADFANPPQDMHAKFKTWVGRAWRELQVSRENWAFMAKRSGGIINPRIFIESGNLPTAPTSGQLFSGASNLATFSIVSVRTLEGSWPAGTAKAYLDLDALRGKLENGEAFNRVSSPAATNAFVYGGRGRWNLDAIAPDFGLINYNSVYLSRISTAVDALRPLRFITWNHWNDYRESLANDFGQPREFTETPEGLLDFYPSPDRGYRLHFNYKRAVTDLVNAQDIPDLDKQYHELLVWMAVMAYAEWDEKPGVYRYAEKHMRKWLRRVENRFLPKLGWSPNVFAVGQNV